MAAEINIVATTVTNTATMEPGSSCMDESTLEECKQSDETREYTSENELHTKGEEHSSIVQKWILKQEHLFQMRLMGNLK